MSERPNGIRCPAKINLALRVLARRDDGYHELDTVFQAIDLADYLRLEPSSRLLLECDDSSLPTGPENLVLLAADALQRWAGKKLSPVRLQLTKRIPAQGGLGGGSSDAAGALRLLSLHWRLAVPAADLIAMAAGIGADVPFFLVGGTARGRERGDRIEPLPFIGPLALVLGLPPFGVPTAEVFRRVSSRLTLPSNGVSLPCSKAAKWPEDKDFSFAVNDLEPIVFEGWPVLRSFRDSLVDVGACHAMLSGSGSTVYGIFEDEGSAAVAARQLAATHPDWKIVSAKAEDRVERRVSR